MTDKQKKITFWAAVIILVILGILFFFLIVRDKEPEFIPTTNREDVPEFQPPSANIQYNPELVPKHSDTEFSAVNLARNYVERLGSWSTDNQLHNIEELVPLSSAKMRAYLETIQADYNNNDFTGITTKSLTIDIVSSDDNSATILVGTQRISTTQKEGQQDLKEDIFMQDAEVKLIKSGTKWLVDSVEWK